MERIRACGLRCHLPTVTTGEPCFLQNFAEFFHVFGFLAVSADFTELDALWRNQDGTRNTAASTKLLFQSRMPLLDFLGKLKSRWRVHKDQNELLPSVVLEFGMFQDLLVELDTPATPIRASEENQKRALGHLGFNKSRIVVVKPAFRGGTNLGPGNLGRTARTVVLEAMRRRKRRWLFFRSATATGGAGR